MIQLNTIQLSEIRNLRLTCAEPNCGGTVLLALSDLASTKDRRLEQLRECPRCKHPWMTATHPLDLARVPEKMPTIQDLALLVYESISDLLKRLKNESHPVGFTVALEIEGDLMRESTAAKEQ